MLCSIIGFHLILLFLIYWFVSSIVISSIGSPLVRWVFSICPLAIPFPSLCGGKLLSLIWSRIQLLSFLLVLWHIPVYVSGCPHFCYHGYNWPEEWLKRFCIVFLPTTVSFVLVLFVVSFLFPLFPCILCCVLLVCFYWHVLFVVFSIVLKKNPRSMLSHPIMNCSSINYLYLKVEYCRSLLLVNNLHISVHYYTTLHCTATN